MFFSSLGFLFFFLPLVGVGYLFIKTEFSNFGLFLLSLYFIFWVPEEISAFCLVLLLQPI